MATATMIACPKCRAYMFCRSMDEVEIDLCTSCGGIWLDEGELAELAETKADVPEEGQKRKETGLECPRCGDELFEQKYSAASELLVDVCGHCRGVYLDRGELDKVRNLGSKVEAAFPPATRAKYERQAQKNEQLSALYGAATPVSKRPFADKRAYLKKVYGLLVASLGVTAVGSLVGLEASPEAFFPAVGAEIVLFIACLFLRQASVFNVVLLFAYTFASGFTMAAVERHYLASGQGWAIAAAVGITAVIFLVLTAYVHISQADFSWMGGFLFVSLIGLVLGFPLCFFLGGPVGLLSVFGAICFSGWILYDTSRILLKYSTEDVIPAVIDLYLDLVNLFLDILRIVAKSR